MNQFIHRVTPLCFLLLVGCTVGPDYQKPDLTSHLPGQYHRIECRSNERTAGLIAELTAEPSTDRWWTTFNDSAINQLVDTALLHNLDLATADANIKQARAQLRINESASLPQLSAGGRIGRDRISKNGEFLSNIPIQNPDVNFTDYRTQFDASWEIDLFGHNRRQVEAAQARLTSVEDQRDEVALRIAAEVVRTAIDYRAWRKRTKNAQLILQESKQLLELVILQQQAGLLSESDVMEAELAMHQAAAAIPSFQSATFASVMAMTVLTNQSHGEVATLLQANADIPAVPDHIASPGMPSDLLLRRPDLRSAERNLAAATADIGVAVAEQYPRLTLVGNGGLDSVTPGKFTQLASTFWNLGPQLSIPLFAGGRLTAQVKGREAARDAALAQYRQAVLTAFADTETALIRYQRERQRLTQIKQAFDTQHRQLNLAEQRYQAGETSFINVLQARQQLAQIHEQQLASQQALAGNLTALFKSLGGSTKN